MYPESTGCGTRVNHRHLPPRACQPTPITEQVSTPITMVLKAVWKHGDHVASPISTVFFTATETPCLIACR